MNAQTIEQLAAIDPNSPLPDYTLNDVSLTQQNALLHWKMRDRFLAKYIKPDFGWYIALQFANHGRPFIYPLYGRDRWIYCAYQMLIDPRYNFSDVICEAYHISRVANDKPALGNNLRAFMLNYDKCVAPEAHLSEVSRRTGIRYEVLEAFEVLFYNVIDRQEDGAFLAAEVYPDTRFIEFDENYMRNSQHSDLIKRVAYNHGDMDLTAYLAGVGDHTFLKKISARDDREAELTRYMMGNGLLLSHTNLLNQRSVGLSRVSTLLAASRQSGAVTEEPAVGGIYPLFSAALDDAMKISREGVVAQMRIDAGMTVDV